jgi:hypothetical protein
MTRLELKHLACRLHCSNCRRIIGVTILKIQFARQQIRQTNNEELSGGWLQWKFQCPLSQKALLLLPRI